MQTCWNCQAQQFDGSIFCSECGANLITRDSKGSETRTSLNLPQRKDRQAREDREQSADMAAVQPAPPSGTGFSLMLAESGIRLSLEMGKDLLVGRSDEKRGIFPDIDLGEHGGLDAGVSRRHATLSLQHKSCVVKDLGSANGTFINNRRIPPNQPTLINHGDELRFGNLLLRVETH
jgi:hypothetical protein